MKTNVAVLAGSLLLSFAATPGLAASPPEVGSPAPELTLLATDGTSYSLDQETEGPRVVIFFRGSW